jgi:4'-phosphopantetheinyl transferase
MLCFKEYDLCYNLVKECAPHTAIPYAPTNVDSFRECCVQFSTTLSTKLAPHVTGQIMTAMLPLLMMRHRRISRAKWRDCVTSTGKHWIEQVSTGITQFDIVG